MAQLAYCVCQLERATSTAKKHWQGYAEFDRNVRMAHIKKLFGDSAMHLEPAMGSSEENRAYCTKDDTAYLAGGWRFEVGVISRGQGRRRNGADVKKPLDDAIDLIKGGKKVRDLIIDYPKMVVLHHRGLEKLEDLSRAPSEMRSVKTIVHWGDSGAGKSYCARHAHASSDVYRLPLPRGADVWWTGYAGQKVIIIDDMVHRFKYMELLTILDDYPLVVEVKGGHVCAEWDTVYICSVKPPHEWFPKSWDRQLERRLDEIWQFFGEYPSSTKCKAHPKDGSPECDGVPVVAPLVPLPPLNDSPEIFEEFELSELSDAAMDAVDLNVDDGENELIKHPKFF